MNLLKHAFRQMVVRPGLAVTIIVMVAVGIGAATAIFSLFYRILLQPLPVPDPGRLVNIARSGPEPGYARQAFSYPMFRDLQAQQTVFTGIAANATSTANVAQADGAFSVRVDFVSGNYFAVLGLRPALGRLIGRQDEPRVNESAVVVLSYGLWKSRFGADPGVIGRVLKIDGQSLTVVGVAPPRFSGTQLGLRAQIFVPLTMYWRLAPGAPSGMPNQRRLEWLPLFARLHDGVSVEQATAALNTVYARIRRDAEAPLRSLSGEKLQRFLSVRLDLAPGARGQVSSLSGYIAGAARSLSLLLGVTLLVLLIVCVNVANLLLMRGASRTGEIAIRLSMGASRGRLLAELLAESAVPAIVGGILALPVAVMTLTAVGPILPARLAQALGMNVNGPAMAFGVLATVATTIAFGVFPALRGARVDPALAIKAHAAAALGGHGAPCVRSVLVTAQVALSLVLVVLSGLFAASLRNVARIDLGMDVDSVVSFSVSPRQSGYDTEQTTAVLERIHRALAAQPGVTAVGMAALPVIAGAGVTGGIEVEGFHTNSEHSALNLVGASFFRALGIPLLVGRDFAAQDMAAAPRVAIVNERFTRVFVPSGSAIGKEVRFGSNRLRIVGVVANSAYSHVKGQVPPQLFLPIGPMANSPFSGLLASPSFYVRTAISPEALLRTIPRVVASIAPSLPVDNLVTMRHQAREDVFVDRLVSILSASFAALATLLAAIGLYGVMTYSVAMRTRELGLRLALGAEPSRLRAMVLKQVLKVASIGVAIGLVAAIGLGRVAQALLYGLSAHDPIVLVAGVALIAAVVLAAGYWPARRASRIAPMEALRDE